MGHFVFLSYFDDNFSLIENGKEIKGRMAYFTKGNIPAVVVALWPFSVILKLVAHK